MENQIPLFYEALHASNGRGGSLLGTDDKKPR